MLLSSRFRCFYTRISLERVQEVYLPYLFRNFATLDFTNASFSFKVNTPMMPNIHIMKIQTLFH